MRSFNRCDVVYNILRIAALIIFTVVVCYFCRDIQRSAHKTPCVSQVVDIALQGKITDEVRTYIIMAANKYKTTIPMPIVTFANTTNGIDDNTNMLVFDNAQMNDHTDIFLSEVVPHETAHYIMSVVYPDDNNRHGTHWRQIVTSLGASPDYIPNKKFSSCSQ